MTIRTLGTATSDSNAAQYADEMMSYAVQQIFDWGFQLYIEPTTLLGVAASSMVSASRRVKTSGRSIDVAAEHGSIYDLLDDWSDASNLRRLRDVYSAAGPS